MKKLQSSQVSVSQTGGKEWGFSTVCELKAIEICCRNNKANAIICSFFTSVVLQYSSKHLIASMMKGSALHLVKWKGKCQGTNLNHQQKVNSLSTQYLCQNCHGSKHH